MMQDDKIFYQKFGTSCYQLAKPYMFETLIRQDRRVEMPFCSIDVDGQARLEAGFCWDGASGPAVQTKDTMRNSAEHDCKYRLIREGLLTMSCREIADQELKETGELDGMSDFRAEAFCLAVDKFGQAAAEGGNPILQAP